MLLCYRSVPAAVCDSDTVTAARCDWHKSFTGFILTERLIISRWFDVYTTQTSEGKDLNGFFQSVMPSSSCTHWQWTWAAQWSFTSHRMKSDILRSSLPLRSGCLRLIAEADLHRRPPSAALQHRKLHNITRTTHTQPHTHCWESEIVSSLHMFAEDWYSSIVPAPEHTMPCNAEGGGRIHVDPSRLIGDFMLHRRADKKSIHAFILPEEVVLGWFTVE